MKKNEQTEPFQRKVRKKHKKMKIRLIGMGKNKKKEKGWSLPDYERSKSAPPVGEELEKKKLTEALHAFFNVADFSMKEDLNSKFWLPGDRIEPQIRDILKQIAKDFFEKLEIDAKILDITLTGSIANYNWTSQSDVDLHIVVDFRDIGEHYTFIKDYFTAKKNEWNFNHDIKIKGHDVEIYVQDDREPHASTGVYSLLYDRWNVKPSKTKITTNTDNVYKKASAIANMANDVHALFSMGKYKQALKASEKVMNKIKRMRQCGLEKGGELSVENLAFKTLRRNGYLEKLSNLRRDSYDELMSIEAKRDEQKKQYF